MDIHPDTFEAIQDSDDADEDDTDIPQLIQGDYDTSVDPDDDDE